MKVLLCILMYVQKTHKNMENIYENIEKRRKIIMTLLAIGAAIAVFTGIGAGIGIGLATAKSADAIARQPEASGKIQTALLLGCALAEATAIYGFVIALLLVLKL